MTIYFPDPPAASVAPAGAGLAERSRSALRAALAAPGFARLGRIAAVPLLMLLAAVSLRAMSFVPTVIDSDEGLYMLQAREWLAGRWPFVGVWDMHPLGAPAMMAAAMGVLGESIFAIRLLGAACVAATASALFWAVRAFGASRMVGFGAGITYVAHSVFIGGLATNTEVLFAPFVAGAMTLAIRGVAATLRDRQAPGWGTLCAMGGLVGLAMLIKPVVMPEGCLAFLLLVLPAWWCGLLPTRRALAMALAYAALSAAPTGLMALLYAVRGELDAFLDGTFLAPMRYTSGGRLGFGDALKHVLDAAYALLWPMLLAAVAMAWSRRRSPEIAAERMLVFITVLWFAAATCGVVMPGMYFDHYFLLWLPPLSVLAALGADRLLRQAPARLAAAGFVLLIGSVSLDAWYTDFDMRRDRGLSFTDPDPPGKVAAYIRRRIQPGESIFVANYHPVVYVLANAAVPTRYAFPGHLTCAFDRVTGVDVDREIRRVLDSGPRFIVVDRGWWTAMRGRARNLISAALAGGYTRVTSIQEERGPVEIWRRD